MQTSWLSKGLKYPEIHNIKLDSLSNKEGENQDTVTLMNRYTVILLAFALTAMMWAYPRGSNDPSPLANLPPVADAGPDQTVMEGETVILDGSGSYDPDGLISIGANGIVNDDSGSQWQTPPSIGTDSMGNVYAVWEDYRTGGFDIYGSHMAHDGSVFATNVKINDDINPNKQSRPELAVEPDGTVHVVWEDYRNNNWDIYYASSTDGGLSYSANLLVTTVNSTDWQNNPSVDVDSSGTVHVVWEDDRDGNWSIYYANSLDGFSTNTKVSEDTLPGNQWSAAVRVGDTGTIHVGWEGASDIYYAKSTDGGTSFGSSVLINDDGGNTTQGKVTMAVEAGGILHLAWEDTRLGDSDIFYARSADDGNTFGPNVRINDDSSAEGQGTPSLAVEVGEFVHVAWSDARDGGWDIYYAASFDRGVTFLPNMKVNDDMMVKYWQTRPSVAAEDGGYFHVAWKDSRNKPSGLLYDIFHAEGKVSKLYYEWDLGDGSPVVNDPIVSHVYPGVGVYTARLTVWDEAGDADNDTAIITVEKEQVPVQIEVDIDPDTLNLKSKGKWITVYVEVIGGDPRDIDAGSVLLNGTLGPENNTKYGFVTNESSYIMDHDGDGVEERMFKFNRSEVQRMVPVGDNVTLTLTLRFVDGSEFSGSDTIRVIDPPEGKEK